MGLRSGEAEIDDSERKSAEIRRALLKYEFKSWTSLSAEACKILLSWLIALLTLPFFASLYVYKFLVQQVAQIVDPELRPVSPLDTHFVMDNVTEQDSIHHDYERSPLNSIGLYAKCPGGKTDIVELTQRLQKHLIENDSDWNWKLKCYLVRFCGHSFWKADPNTQAANHVKQASLQRGESIHEFMNAWILKPYPPKTPMWEFLIIDTEEEEITAFRIHHSLGDGLSIFSLGSILFEAKHHPLVETILNHPPLRWTLFEKMSLIVRSPSLFLTVLGMIYKTSDPFTLDAGRKPEQLLAMTSLNFTEVKRLSKKRGVAFNTVLLTLYGGAIRRFLESRKNGKPIPNDLLIPVALPWPGRPKNFIGNHFNAMLSLVPTNIPDPLQRMDQVQANLSKNFLANIVFAQMCRTISGLLPLSLLMYFRTLTRVRYILSPFLSADSYTSYDGRTPESINTLSGLFFPTFGMVTTTTSVKDELIWTIMGDKSLFKTQDCINIFAEKYIVEEFQELVSATGSTSYGKAPLVHSKSKEGNCSG